MHLFISQFRINSGVPILVDLGHRFLGSHIFKDSLENHRIKQFLPVGG